MQMKRVMSLVLTLMLVYSQAYAATEWLNSATTNRVTGASSPSDLDTNTDYITAPLHRLLSNYRSGANISYVSATTVSVGVGEVVCSNTAGTIHKFRQNTAAVTVTFANIDTGTEAAATTYYVYACADADSTEFTVKLSTTAVSTGPSGSTYFALLGTIYNDASSNIEQYKVYNSQTTVYDGSVSTLKLKTYYGEVSGAATYSNPTLPGGEYGFYPQLKGSVAARVSLWSDRDTMSTLPAAYTTTIGFSVTSGTAYAQQRYISASGKDYWIFLLIDKDTKSIVGGYAAPDHPAYGNGGDFVKIPHPFTNYINDALPSNLEIVLVEKESAKAIIGEGGSVLENINNNYYPNMKKIESYVPLHSGKILGQDLEMVNDIPGYVRVRKLIKLTEEEKTAKAKKEADSKTQVEQARIKRTADKQAAMVKLEALGLSKDEIDAISN